VQPIDHYFFSASTWNTTATFGKSVPFAPGTSQAFLESQTRPERADGCIKHGSTIIISPRLRITGNLECRPTQIVDADGMVVKALHRWVLVVANLTRL